ncbi:3'-5' exonuclease [Vibrio coralliilyticus]|uniref:DNA 3'-5' helicase II n=1 Tax=Vibrio coralliilyticus TaxID=190893 RepID=A0AAP6ZPJ2_9VIBR|nr:nuclease-related domain-containing DEAD/DEAH box helicase [Vibrio coralliilyticus]ERB67318.1 DNA helicase II [Vibrio coralliilyticus OCN008]NOJ22603.1 AAA family ATPase [Vibrio coralliilyticus]QIJ84500.1 AAA family ATPase [Vibrio coralliilyticus OCN008]
MAEIIPSLNSCLTKMERGEKRFARRLESFLESDYLCWFDIPVGKRRRYPDFTILHPQRGLLFLEVKDWKIENIKSINAKQVELFTNSGLKTLANPLEQVRQCAYTVANKLTKDKQLLSKNPKYQGKLCFPYGYGVVLPFVSRKQLNDAIPIDAQESILQSHLVICSDEMTESADPEHFQARLWEMFNYKFDYMLSLPQIDRIRWHLYPEVRIVQQQDSLFPEPLDHEVNASETIPDIVKIMDIQQEQLARSLGDGHRVIHGVAGSGKTLILGYRCLHLADTLNKPILVLCYNITLAAKLRSFIEEKGISARVQVYHFHDWCGQQIKTYHVNPIENEDRKPFELSVETVIQGVEFGQIPSGQYGAVLIDEGHDFEPEWLTLVTKMVDPDTNSLLLLYDDAQSIYKKSTGLDFSLSSVGIQAQGRTTILKLNYRNTREILDFSYKFAKKYFEGFKHKEIPLIEPEGAGCKGDAPILKKFDTLVQETEFVLRCVKHWIAKGKDLKEVAILYPTHSSGKAMADVLKGSNVPFQWLATPAYKKKYDPSADKINLIPVRSSKGLEFETVVMIDGSYLPKDKDEEVDAARVMYVGFTRATKNLLTTFHRQNTFSEQLSIAIS